MQRIEEQSLWSVLERAVKGRDARAFTTCVETAGGFVGADAGLLSAGPEERRWLDRLLGAGSGTYGDEALEPLLASLRPLEGGLTLTEVAKLEGSSPFQALIATPLVGVEGQPLGELVFARHRPGAFTPEERALVRAAASFLERQIEVVLLSIRLGVLARRPTDHFPRPEGAPGRSATDLLVHDLKNPLSVIVLAGESARDSGDPRVAQLMDDVLESAAIAQRLVNDMLDLGAGSAALQMSPERVDLRALASRLITRVSMVAAQREQTLALRCSAPAAIVEGDPFLLERLMRNLLDNAFKYAPPASAITVVIEERGPGYLLRVEDEGQPIAPALRAAIFEQDTRLVSTRRGSHGLGLKLCRVVAELHGAQLTVDPSSTGGNAFSLELKRA